MAAENQWSCPDCLDNGEEMACLSPCLHQACLGCALRWVEQRPSCPLCGTLTTTVSFSVQSDNNYLTFNVPGPAEPWAEDEQGPAGPAPWSLVMDVPPEVWANFFQSDPVNTRPLLLWVQRALKVMAQGDWWDLDVMEATIVTCLCESGLDEEVLVRELQSCMPEDTEAFVRQLRSAAMHLCGSKLRRHLDCWSPSPWWEDNSSVGSPSPTDSPIPPGSPSPAGSPRPIDSSGLTTSSSPSSSSSSSSSDSPPAPVPVEQEQPQQELGAAAAAGPSAPGWDRDLCPGGPQRPPKRRAPSPKDSIHPSKRPRCQQP